MPLLTSEQVAELWFKRFGSRPIAADLTRLMELSKGLPLYLRYVETPADTKIQGSSLETIELRRFQMLPPLVRDIVHLRVFVGPIAYGGRADKPYRRTTPRKRSRTGLRSYS